ncbi:acyl-CoA synthetase [Polaromonas sp. JS666]|uniref:LpxL/LpxP family acyltransferase n=1 Tax=Polaromonas sp. (strain JS666 / ATCC BAA-500) TaxID=296591 RepID=UPI0000464A5D|nr:putative lauroyl/myristoyl acyltransferase involved in LPS biosynthesis [Polaromonas sp. JS666]
MSSSPGAREDSPLSSTGGAVPQAAWRQRPERSNMLMLRVMTWISLRLGRSAGRCVLYGIAAYFLIANAAARRASRDYLRRVLQLPDTARVGWRHVFRHFLSFASTIHDRIYLINDRFNLFDIRVHQEHLVAELTAAHQGVFLMGAHAGSFEVLRAIGRRQPGLRVAMVMYEENARKLNAALSAINPTAQQDIVPLGHADSMLRVNDLLSTGSVVGMLADRRLNRDATRPIPFLGEPAEFPVGPFRMAAILRRPVFFMVGLYRGGNRYDIHFETLADFSSIAAGGREAAVQAAMARYALLLEQHCRAAPYNWFNFFDFWQADHPLPAANPVPPHD